MALLSAAASALDLEASLQKFQDWSPQNTAWAMRVFTFVLLTEVGGL